MSNKYELAMLVFLQILFPSLWNVPIIKERKLVVESELELVGENIFTSILHYWVIDYIFLDFVLAVELLWDLNHTIDSIVLDVDGDALCLQ